MNRLVMGGMAFAMLGLLGFAIPIFTTQKTQEVARIGDLRLQTTESTSHNIPPWLSAGGLVFGGLLAGAGLMKSR